MTQQFLKEKSKSEEITDQNHATLGLPPLIFLEIDRKGMQLS